MLVVRLGLGCGECVVKVNRLTSLSFSGVHLIGILSDRSSGE